MGSREAFSGSRPQIERVTKAKTAHYSHLTKEPQWQYASIRKMAAEQGFYG